jgi:hypothetical protein
MFAVELPRPEALAELAGGIAQQRGADQGPFDLVVELEPGVDPEPWRRAGATWILTDFGSPPRVAKVRETIEARGP